MVKPSPFARFVALIGQVAVAVRHSGDGAREPVYGTAPVIPAAKPQGKVPTLKMPTAKGWEGEHTPTAAAGLKVNAFARGLVHPRNMHVLPNGDVLVAESMGEREKPRGLFDHAMSATMQRAGASGDSANRVTLLRDADGDGVAEIRHAYIENVRQPYGMVLIGSTLYVGASDAVLAYPYDPAATKITTPGKLVMTLKPGGHWTRNLIASKDGTKLYVAVGSVSNIGDGGMEIEKIAPASTNSTSPPASPASMALASAILSAWLGNRPRTRSIPSSTSAMASAMKPRPIT